MENGKNEDLGVVSLTDDELRAATGGAKLTLTSPFDANGLKDVLAKYRRSVSEISAATLLVDRIDRRSLLNDTLTN